MICVFLEILRPNMWFIFNIDPFFKASLPFQMSMRAFSSSLPSGDFPGEGDVVSCQDAIHHNYLIEIPKQYVVLFRIEWRTR